MLQFVPAFLDTLEIPSGVVRSSPQNHPNGLKKSLILVTHHHVEATLFVLNAMELDLASVFQNIMVIPTLVAVPNVSKTMTALKRKHVKIIAALTPVQVFAESTRSAESGIIFLLAFVLRGILEIRLDLVIYHLQYKLSKKRGQEIHAFLPRADQTVNARTSTEPQFAAAFLDILAPHHPVDLNVSLAQSASLPKLA
jgi:hypothetical protein